jgi:murein DD-endopeptidase MepM/ murein hydrolase activator NlpD
MAPRHIQHFLPKFVAMMGALAFLLGGCAGYDYRNIPPKHQVRNMPVPVPWPKTKPTPPRKAAAVPTPVRTSSRQTYRSHVVARGETVYGIARANGLEVRHMIRANSLRAPYTLSVGQKLRLPAGAARVHVVRKGDTSYSISRRYGVDLSSLTRLNRLRPPYNLAIGQELRLPTGAGGTGASGGTPRRAAVPPPPPRQGSKFLWPVKGRILSGYGPKAGGQHNDGINIRVAQGSEVRAADAGVVAYAGDELSGYGNLLLIRHAGGWVTAYAHNDRLLVKRGDKVSRGQVIARAGATGGVSEAQLHFELRKGRAAVDPIRYLSGRKG